MSEIQVTPTGAALGADITGVDLSRPLDQETIQALTTAFYEHCLLRFRGQSISKADQVRFSGCFGDPVPHPTNTKDRDPDYPEITIISNIEEDGKAVGALGNADLQFHADLIFLEEPGTVSLLYCVEAPDRGGDTYWSSGYAAYEGLNPQARARLSGLMVAYVHPNPDYNPPEPPRHPLICTHPETERKTLFFSPNAAHSVEDERGGTLTEDASSALLQQLFAYATQEQYIWRQQWRPGDLIMWDNRCTMHRRDRFSNRERRLMLRTQMVGPCTK
jgi:taurine dioxygenase